MNNIGWVAINCSGLIVLILGSVFMRGHNNRNALFVEAFFPVIFWAIYLNVGSFLVDSGYHYIVLIAGPLLYSTGLFYLIYRVRIETRLMYLFGKYVAPLTGSRKDRYQNYAIRSVRSKGLTNFQLMLIAIYAINTALWAISISMAVWVGIVEQVPFFLQTNEPTEKLSYVVEQYYGFRPDYILLDTVFDWVNTIWSLMMIYFIFTDYVNPDEIGGRKNNVPNHVGHGARELIL